MTNPAVIAIANPVGAGPRASNRSVDVRAVQHRLNDLMPKTRSKLAVDGVVGPKTIGAIREFQLDVVHLRKPDGRVDPKGKTETSLNSPGAADAWSRAAAVKPASQTKRSATRTTPSEGDGLAEIDKAILEIESDDPVLARDLEAFINDNLVELKALFGFIGNGRVATEFLLTIRFLKDAGQSNKEIAAMFKLFAMPGKDKAFGPSYFLRYIRTWAVVDRRMLSVLKGLGKATIVAAVAICAFEVHEDVQKRNYGAGAGRIYRLGTGILIPWAGLVDGLQKMLEAAVPEAKSPALDVTLRLLKSMNPAMLGGVAVDTVVSLIQGIVTSFQAGKIDMAAVHRLSKRIEAGPAGVFAELADLNYLMSDASADWYYENVIKRLDAL